MWKNSVSGYVPKRKQTGVAQYMWDLSIVLPNKFHNQAPQPAFVLIHPPLGHGLPAAQATVNLPLIANIGGLQHSPQLL